MTHKKTPIRLSNFLDRIQQESYQQKLVLAQHGQANKGGGFSRGHKINFYHAKQLPGL